MRNVAGRCQQKRQEGMRNKSNKLVVIMRCLFISWCFLAAPIQASVVNLTYSEDIDSFSSTWRIDDNGGGDFSGTDSITGVFWEIGLTTDAAASLQDTIAHILGPHGEGFTSSSLDHGVLPAGYLEELSFVVHDGHIDDFTMTSDYVDGGYNVSFAGLHSVPIPAAFWLFASGLGLLRWMKRKQA
jgi:hypothetical protein